MSSILLDQLRSVFNSSSVSELGRALGEENAPVQTAIRGLMPALTAGVINRVAETEGATRLFELLNSTPFATDPAMSELVNRVDHRQKAAESGNTLIWQLFTDPSDRLAQATAEYSGVSLGSAHTLSGLVMSVLMGFLRQQVTGQHLTQAQLTALLGGEAETTRGAVPAALAGGLGWLLSTPRTATSVPPGTNSIPPAKNQDQSAGSAWWRWLLLALALLALVFFLVRGCRDETASQTSRTTRISASDTLASDPDGNDPAVLVGVDLPGGRKLSLVEHSFNDSLARYLANKSSQTPRVFTFDNLTFETDSARITAKARPQVDALIQIMEAYPGLAIRIEGNTDSTGDDAINDPLSGQRAEAVKQALIQGGIAASRVTTRERGDTRPVASNQTPAGRQMNRRIDVVITKH